MEENKQRQYQCQSQLSNRAESGTGVTGNPCYPAWNRILHHDACRLFGFLVLRRSIISDRLANFTVDDVRDFVGKVLPASGTCGHFFEGSQLLGNVLAVVGEFTD